MVNERDPERRYFGHYQALDPLHGAGEAQLWHAWDPYLGRYVVIVSLGQIDPEVLRSSLRDLDGALRRWTGVSAFRASDVWHFFPGDQDQSSFIVLAPSGRAHGSAEGEPSVAATPLLAAVPAVFAAWPGKLWGALGLALLLVSLVPLALFIAAANRSDNESHAVSAVVVALATPTLAVEPTATTSPAATPTSTVAPVAVSRKQAVVAPRAAAARKKESAAVDVPVPQARTRAADESAESIVRAIQPGEVVALPNQMEGATTLVKDWLMRHCLQVEQQYLEAGRTFACGWRGVAIEGTLPEVTATFTQIDRHMQTGRDLHTSKRVRLLCTDRCVALEQETSVVEVY